MRKEDHDFTAMSMSTTLFLKSFSIEVLEELDHQESFGMNLKIGERFGTGPNHDVIGLHLCTPRIGLMIVYIMQNTASEKYSYIWLPFSIKYFRFVYIRKRVLHYLSQR